MPMFRIQAHIDQISDISRLYGTFSAVAVYTHYTAVSMTWWHVDKLHAEAALINFLEENNIEWSGVFVKELLRGSV